MKKTYDYIIITHLPAFYKVNLYNEISKKKNIFVIFISNGSIIRTKDFTNSEIIFEYMYLNKGEFENRNKIFSVLKIASILLNKKYKKLIVGGWDLPEFWATVFLTKKEKNCIALESTLFESNIYGLRFLAKKIFLSRISIVFSSGLMHKKLAQALSFKGEIQITFGVGIINYIPIQTKKRNEINKKINKLLYIGRLSKEKNLSRLIETVNELPLIELTIIGAGPECEELKKLANKNIKFFDHVENKKLQDFFYSNDIFILPSLSETWGLVIDEAIYFGLPVLVSKYVGSAEELVIRPSLGLDFDPYSKIDIKNKILQITNTYNYALFKKNVLNFHIIEKDQKQVHIYSQ